MDDAGLKAVDRAWVDLTQWLGRALQYGSDHAAVRQLGRAVHERMVSAQQLCGSLDIGVLPGALTLRDVELPSSALKTRTAPHLHARGAVMVRFMMGMSFEELEAFVVILTMSVHEVYAAGGLKLLLAQRGAQRVVVEELTHEITSEEIAEERRQRDVRELFRETVEALLAGHRLEALNYQALLDLLQRPELAAHMIETQDRPAVAEAVAGLALVALAEERRTGIPLTGRVIKLLAELGGPARAQLFAGFGFLIDELRDALARVIEQMVDDPALSGLVLAALRANGLTLDVFFDGLALMLPDRARRASVLRWVGVRLFDLPAEEPSTLGLLVLLTREPASWDPYRGEKGALAAAALGLLRERIAMRPREATRIPDDAFGPEALDRLDHRMATELLAIGARLVDFQPHAEALPAVAEALSAAGRTGAVAGIFRGMVHVKDPRWRALTDETLTRLAATQAAATAARSIERFAGGSAESLDELGPMLQIVAQHHAQPMLEALERAQNKDTRRLLLRVLPAAGPALMPLVRERLRSPDWFVVRNMIALLRPLGGRSVDLFSVAQHENVNVRMEVVRNLRAMDADEQAVGILIDYLGDPEMEIRGGALTALADAKLTDRDVARLEAMALDEKRPEDARKAAVRALGRSGSDLAARCLFRMLEPKSLLESQATTQLRDRVAAALRTSKAPEAAALFAQALQSSTWRVRKACERAVEELGG